MPVFHAFVRCWPGRWTRAFVFCIGLTACASPVQEPVPAAASDANGTAPVTIVAFGDMPYRAVDFATYEQLLSRISAEAPDVTINVDDINGAGRATRRFTCANATT